MGSVVKIKTASREREMEVGRNEVGIVGVGREEGFERIGQ